MQTATQHQEREGMQLRGEREKAAGLFEIIEKYIPLADINQKDQRTMEIYLLKKLPELQVTWNGEQLFNLSTNNGNKQRSEIIRSLGARLIRRNK
ncbi:MAG: hypothetical protein K9G61_01850 [Bacteroidales bacterium]|nr:hypothetical protein [Bacteroidales bacterium]